MRPGQLISLVITGLCCHTAIIPAAAQAVEPAGKVEISTDVSFMSRYVWRGLQLNGDPVLQPSATVGYRGFSFNAWGNMDLTDANDEKTSISELDYTVDYSFSIKSYNISFGTISYTFPNTQYDATTELYCALGLDAVLSPVITVYQDVDEAEGTYVSLGIGHSLALERLNTSLDLSCALGACSKNHNNFYYGVDCAAVSDIKTGASMTFSINESFSLIPSLYYSGLIGSRIREASEHKDNLVVGLTASVSF